MREPAVGGARAAAVGTDVAGDVAHAPVATLPLVVQRRASRREPLRLHLVGPAIDRELVLPAGLQHVGQPAGTAEVEVGTQRHVDTVGLDLPLVEEAVVSLYHPVDSGGNARQTAR